MDIEVNISDNDEPNIDQSLISYNLRKRKKDDVQTSCYDETATLKDENTVLKKRIYDLEKKIKSIQKKYNNDMENSKNKNTESNTIDQYNDNSINATNYHNNENTGILASNRFHSIISNDEDNVVLEYNQTDKQIILSSIKENNEKKRQQKKENILPAEAKNNNNNLTINNTQNFNENNINSNTIITDPILKTKIIKPPPLNIHLQEINHTVDLLKMHNIKNAEVKRINNYKHTVYTKDMESYNIIKKQLLQLETPFFTYTQKTEKPKTMLLRGLDANENLNSIIEELKSYENLNFKINKLVQFETSRSRQQNRKLPLYLIQLSPNSDIKNLYAIKVLDHRKIYWEKIKNEELSQCRRCQRFGHTATNCNLQYRCVKCDQNHKPGECVRTNKEIPAYCINCKQSGHPASYKKCEVYLSTVNKIKQLRDIKRNSNNSKLHQMDPQIKAINLSKSGFNSTYRQENVLYSDIIKQLDTQEPAKNELNELRVQLNDYIEKTNKQIDFLVSAVTKLLTQS